MINDDACRRLWGAVLMTLFEDATGAPRAVVAGGRPHWMLIAEARAWFEAGGRDLEEVCLMAGVCPRQVRATVLRAIARSRNGPSSKPGGRTRDKNRRIAGGPDGQRRHVGASGAALGGGSHSGRVPTP